MAAEIIGFTILLIRVLPVNIWLTASRTAANLWCLDTAHFYVVYVLAAIAGLLNVIDVGFRPLGTN